MDSSPEIKTTLAELMPIIKEKLSLGQSVSIFPNGTSMLPMLRQGIDSVILSPLPQKLKKYDLPLYRRDNGQFVLHRIVKAGDDYTCMGDNQFAKEKGIRYDQMIAVVTGFTRGEKKHSVEEFPYRLYCRLWYHSRHLRHFWRRGIGFLYRRLHK